MTADHSDPMSGDQPVALEVEGLDKLFGGHDGEVRAVDGVSFTVEEGSFFTLLGPSGCGKTTTLRCVAGLEKPNGGSIRLAGDLVSGDGMFVPPYRRDIGMVFQSYAIWPHMTVFDNAAYPLKIAARRRGAARERRSKSEIAQRVEEVLATVGLEGLEGRMATQLSGGQQQRLALARAVVRRPKLLLLDEPLSNLDARLRDRMRAELRDLQRRLGITTLYVTHDQQEALSMSSRIAVMEHGKVVQEGSPRDIYLAPGSPFVASFIGESNFLEGSVVRAGPIGAVATPLGDRPLVADIPVDLAVGSAVTVTARPESVEVRAEGSDPFSDEANAYRGVVEKTVFLGKSIDVAVRVGDAVLSASVHPTMRLEVGDSVIVALAPAACGVLVGAVGPEVGEVPVASGPEGDAGPVVADPMIGLRRRGDRR